MLDQIIHYLIILSMPLIFCSPDLWAQNNCDYQSNPETATSNSKCETLPSKTELLPKFSFSTSEPDSQDYFWLADRAQECANAYSVPILEYKKFLDLSAEPFGMPAEDKLWLDAFLVQAAEKTKQAIILHKQLIIKNTSLAREKSLQAPRNKGRPKEIEIKNDIVQIEKKIQDLHQEVPFLAFLSMDELSKKYDRKTVVLDSKDAIQIQESINTAYGIFSALKKQSSWLMFNSKIAAKNKEDPIDLLENSVALKCALADRSKDQASNKRPISFYRFSERLNAKLYNEQISNAGLAVVNTAVALAVQEIAVPKLALAARSIFLVSRISASEALMAGKSLRFSYSEFNAQASSIDAIIKDVARSPIGGAAKNPSLRVYQVNQGQETSFLSVINAETAVSYKHKPVIDLLKLIDDHNIRVYQNRVQRIKMDGVNPRHYERAIVVMNSKNNPLVSKQPDFLSGVALIRSSGRHEPLSYHYLEDAMRKIQNGKPAELYGAKVNSVEVLNSLPPLRPGAVEYEVSRLTGSKASDIGKEDLLRIILQIPKVNPNTQRVGLYTDEIRGRLYGEMVKKAGLGELTVYQKIKVTPPKVKITDSKGKTIIKQPKESNEITSWIDIKKLTPVLQQ